MIKERITPISAFVAQIYVQFSLYEMAFDLKNSRWPPLAVFLDFENWIYLSNGNIYRDGVLFNNVYTLRSN